MNLDLAARGAAGIAVTCRRACGMTDGKRREAIISAIRQTEDLLEDLGGLLEPELFKEARA